MKNEVNRALVVKKNVIKKSLLLGVLLTFCSVLAFAKDPTTTLDVATEAGSNAFYSLDALPSIKNLDWVGYNSTGSGSGGCISESHWKLSSSRTLTFKVKNCEKVWVNAYFSKDATTKLKYSINGGTATEFATNGTLKKTCAEGEFDTNNTGEITLVLSADNDVIIGEVRFYKTGGTPPVTPTVNSVTVSPASVTLDPNGTQQLTATVDATPASADKTVTWTSSAPGIATVSESGLVTAVAQGTATITATSNLDNTKSGTCSVIVNAPAAPIPVTAISIKSSTTLGIGESETLAITYTPADANQGKAVTWTSANSSIATVDANGKVTGVAAGTTTVTATSTTDPNIKSSCTVTIQAIAVTGVTLNKATASIKVGATETLIATVAPSNATNKDVTWSSDKTGIATVNANGVVTGVAEGTAKITVTTKDGGKTASCDVTVTAGTPVPPTQLMIHYPEVYEAKDIAGGYNTPLTVVGGREYEVYYTERTKDGDYPTFSTTTVTDGKTNGISGSTTTTKNVGRPGDTWFEGTVYSASECKKASSKDEFVFVEKGIREHRLSSSDTYQFHVKGFDQFSLWGMDKKLDPKNGNQVFVVKVDGVEQTTDPSLYNTEAYTIRRYNISTAEHLIEISTTCTGSNVCYMGGFSLRVAQEPRTKYLKGNDSTQRVLQTQTIQPIVYVTKYNSIPGAETKFEWLGAEATGIYLAKKEGGLTDTLTISGTAQCPVGTYKYAVVAYYNGVETSRAEGKFTVATDLQAMTELNVEVYQNEEMDQIKFRYYALDETAVQLTWPNGQPAGISGRGAANNIYIIGGTPTAPEGLYPYEITAVGADTTFKGTIKVKKLNYGENPVLYLYKNTGADEKDEVYTHLGKSWNMISRKAKEDGLRPADQYAKYKWILISEDADANNEEVLAVVRGGANLPVLNMNAFSYAYQRNDEMPRGWGEPDNGSISKGGCYITVQRNDHPIFKALNKKRGDKIQILDTVTFKGMMPINILLQGTLCLATSPTRDIEDYEADGKMQTIIHEIPATMRGGAKYIAFPIAKNSTPNLTNDGKKVLNAVVNYLTNNESTVTVPTVQITSFTLNGIAGDIDQINKTIKVNIDRSKYPDINLKEAQPVVTLASNQTTVSPASGETVDLSTSAILPVKYEVTDFINRCVYNVTVTFYSPEGIDEVYAVGDWVNVYDIFGRKIATTNEDIYTMPLPRGVYVIVTESGQTLKITR